MFEKVRVFCDNIDCVRELYIVKINYNLGSPMFVYTSCVNRDITKAIYEAINQPRITIGKTITFKV